MKLPDASRHPAFPTTQWTLVNHAAATEGQGDALGQLLQQYLPALKVHLQMRRRLSEVDAEDLLQSFVLDKVMRQRLLKRADRQRGRFRTFLLCVLDNYLRNAHRRETAQRRQPGQVVQALQDAPEQAAGRTDPGRAFEVAWAQQVLKQALGRMEVECRDSGQERMWQLFQARVIQPTLDQHDPEPYDNLVQRLGFRSPGEASNALVTAKRKYRRLVRDVISAYARDHLEAEQELADLAEALAGAAQD